MNGTLAGLPLTLPELLLALAALALAVARRLPEPARRPVALTAAATLAFLDAVLRDRPRDPSTALARHGELTVHRPESTR